MRHSEPDLRNLLKQASKKEPAADADDEKSLQRKIDGQITEYTQGSGEGIDEVRMMLKNDPDNLDLSTRSASRSDLQGLTECARFPSTA